MKQAVDEARDEEKEEESTGSSAVRIPWGTSMDGRSWENGAQVPRQLVRWGERGWVAADTLGLGSPMKTTAH